MTAEDVRALIANEAAEGINFELKRELPVRDGHDPWMTGGKIGDRAKDVLAQELIAFANAEGGMLVVGIGEDKVTKRAIAPIIPIPRCKEAAERLHQAITDRVEPKLPMFECAGVVTEVDGSSGVVVMRTLQSYLAPHRHSQDLQCYIRRGDRSEPMSMSEIRNAVVRSLSRTADVEKEFSDSHRAFWNWIPESDRRSHPDLQMDGSYVPNRSGADDWAGRWSLRVTGVPTFPFHLSELPRQQWLQRLVPRSYESTGQTRSLPTPSLQSSGLWRPILRGVQRRMTARHFTAIDRVRVDGKVERFLTGEHESRPISGAMTRFSILELLWNFADVVSNTEFVRCAGDAPSQAYGVEVEFSTSDDILLLGHASSDPVLGAGRFVFPRYELDSREGFDGMVTDFARDLWHVAGIDPDWPLTLHWRF